MRENIDVSINKVNRQLYLTGTCTAITLRSMNYSERLRTARRHAELTQADLAEKAGVAQPTISYLENSDATGSEFTTRFARICKVSVDWLADEIGEMRPMVYTTTDPKVIAVARMMEPLPEYGKDAAVEDITKVTQLIKKATGGNGTEG